MATAAISLQPRYALAIRPALVAGLMVGLAECLFFAFVLAHRTIELFVWRQFEPSAMGFVDTGSFMLVLAAPVGAGWTFALLTRRHLTTDVVPRWHLPMSGVLLLLASVLGVVIASGFEPLANSLSGTELVRAFQVAFTSASGIAAFVCTWGVARLLRVDQALWKATLVGVATAATYLALALVLDTLPGWRVGGGDMAMPRVAMVGNLLSGFVGGSVAFQLLKR
jgi:hypothetical protein